MLEKELSTIASDTLDLITNKLKEASGDQLTFDKGSMLKIGWPFVKLVS